MDVAHPGLALAPTLDILALEVLAGTVEPVGLSEIGRRARRGSVSGFAQALDRLVASGLVLRRYGGYALNRDHVVAPLAEQLIGLRAEFMRRLAHLAASWDPPALLLAGYGSFARADGDAASDIDLLLVHPDPAEGLTRDEHPKCGPQGAPHDLWADRAADLAGLVRVWTGNTASVIVVTPAELDRMAEAGEPVVAAWQADAVPMFGELSVLPHCPPSASTGELGRTGLPDRRSSGGPGTVAS